MKIVLVLILACLTIQMNGQTFVCNKNDTSVVTEYLDGKLWAYRNRDGFVVGMTNEETRDNYGRYYQIGILIKNLRDTAVTFNPDKVYSSLVKNNGDTIVLNVYTDEEYQKKIKRSQTWVMILTGFSAGLNAGMAGYSTSTSSTVGTNGSLYFTSTTHYNANAATQARMAADQQINSLGRLFEQERNIKRQGYLKKTTIHPNEILFGYMNIKRKKGKLQIVDIDIDNCKFCYIWDVEKKKE